MSQTSKQQISEYIKNYSYSLSVFHDLISITSVEFTLKEIFEIKLENYDVTPQKLLEIFNDILKAAFFNPNFIYINNVKKKAGLVLVQQKMRDKYWTGNTIQLMLKWIKLRDSGEVKSVESFKKHMDEAYITEENFRKMLNIYGGIMSGINRFFMCYNTKSV